MFVAPYAFISFFPAAFLFGKSGWEYYGWLAPLVVIYAMLASIYIFQRGLVKYESAGH
ncbi:ABC-2 family transporter protein [Paenibacillus aquistagni]|uniref:ABC-2 family transporter protein n=1 Tax=Paenibacillus aquistagni TaxID=1852522 RepID=UPI000A1CAB50|nr:ABC-2 family transporter protein [Paenibacillus aquistagni]